MPRFNTSLFLACQASPLNLQSKKIGHNGSRGPLPMLHAIGSLRSNAKCERVHLYPRIVYGHSCMKTADILFLPRDARSAIRGLAIVCRPSVCLSVCLSVCPSVTLTYRGHIGCTSSKLLITRVSMLRVFAPRSRNVGNSPKGTPLKFRWNRGGVLFSAQWLGISETGQDRTKVAIDDQ